MEPLRKIGRADTLRLSPEADKALEDEVRWFREVVMTEAESLASRRDVVSAGDVKSAVHILTVLPPTPWRWACARLGPFVMGSGAAVALQNWIQGQNTSPRSLLMILLLLTAGGLLMLVSSGCRSLRS